MSDSNKLCDLLVYLLNYQSTAKPTGNFKNYAGKSADNVERELLLRSIFLKIKIILHPTLVITIMSLTNKSVDQRSSNIP